MRIVPPFMVQKCDKGTGYENRVFIMPRYGVMITP